MRHGCTYHRRRFTLALGIGGWARGRHGGKCGVAGGKDLDIANLGIAGDEFDAINWRWVDGLSDVVAGWGIPDDRKVIHLVVPDRTCLGGADDSISGRLGIWSCRDGGKALFRIWRQVGGIGRHSECGEEEDD